MKKLILFLSLLLATAVVSAQSELPSDDRTPRAPEENYKEFGGFLLDIDVYKRQEQIMSSIASLFCGSSCYNFPKNMNCLQKDVNM